MFTNVFDSGNSLIINCKSVELFGLNAAAFLTEAIAIQRKATEKGKLVEDRFTELNRKYITSRTSLSIEDQLVCELTLNSVGIVEKHPDKVNCIYVDLERYIEILSNEEAEAREKVKRRAQILSTMNVSKPAQLSIIEALKKSLDNEPCRELGEAMKDWIDGVYASPKGFLSLPAVKLFKETLYEYIREDIQKGLDIVQLATIQGYMDCNWAINQYEQEMHIRKSTRKGNKLRTTPQSTSRKEDLSDTSY